MSQKSRYRADALIGWFRDFSGSRLNSYVNDERRMVSPPIVLELGNQGFFGLQAPEELGGCALATQDALRVYQQVAAVDPTIAILVGNHNGLGLRAILSDGSDEIRRRLVPALAAGRKLAGFALTESSGGSNPHAIQTSARQQDQSWAIRGAKRWIGLGSWAGVLVVFAKCVDSNGIPLGITAFTIDGATNGLRLGSESMTMGMRGFVQNWIYLDDLTVSDSSRLGAVGGGLSVAMRSMDFSRLGIGSVGIGIMKRAAQLMVRYASRRTVATGRLLDNPVTLDRLEDLTSAISACDALVTTLAAHLDAGFELSTTHCAVCKAVVPELAFQGTDQLMQLLGARGYEETSGVPQLLRDARVLRIFEGPTETMLMFLGSTALNETDSLNRLLGDPFNATHLECRIRSIIDDLKDRTSLPRLAERDERQDQDIAFRTGRVVAAAVLHAAVMAACARRESIAEATARWSGIYLETAIEFALRPLQKGGFSRINDLARTIRAYRDQIGDVVQRLPGADTALDDFLLPDADDASQEALHPVPATSPRVLAGPSEADSHSEAYRAAHSLVFALLEEKLEPAENSAIDEHSSLHAIGIDSVFAVELAVELSKHVSRPLSPDVLYECSTIGELVTYVVGAL